MADGRTYWWAKDAAWLQRDAIVELGEEFGPAGPLVIDALCGMAKLENDAGRVRTGFRALARAAFVDVTLCNAVIAHATQIGVLDDFEADPDGRRFSCRVSGWQADQKKGRAADRDARRRERDAQRASEQDSPANSENSADSEGRLADGADDVSKREDSRPLTQTHVPVGTGQDRTEQNRTSSSLRSEEKTLVELANSTPADPAAKPDGEPDPHRRAVAELFEHWQATCGRPKAKATAERRRAVRARLADGYTVEQVRSAIDGAAVAAFVDERGKRHDDLTLICRNGSKLEDFIDRWERHEAGEDVNPNPSVRGSGVRLRPDGLWSPTLDRLEAQRRRLEMAASKAPKGSGKGKQQGDPGEAGYSPVTALSGDVRGTSG